MPYRRFQRRRRGKEALQAAQSGTMAETSVSKPLIVFCAGTPWSGIAGSDRHLAIALTRHARVLLGGPTAFSAYTVAATDGCRTAAVADIVSCTSEASTTDNPRSPRSYQARCRCHYGRARAHTNPLGSAPFKSPDPTLLWLAHWMMY